MTVRRRNLLVLLLVLGLLLGSFVVVAQKPTKLGLDLQGGVELVYQAKPRKGTPLTPDALDRVIDVMRERVDRLGVAEPKIQTFGEDQVSVGLPDVDDQAAAIKQVGTVAQMNFYDWEVNVIGPSGQPAPDDIEVTGGGQAGTAGALSLYDAVLRASERPADLDKDNSRDGSLFYAVDPKAKRVYGLGEESRGDALKQIPRAQRENVKAKVYEVKEGTVLLRAEKPAKVKGKADQWFVLRDDVALEGKEIKDPEQTFDSGTGGSGEAIVTFNFTDKGRKIWRDTTRTIAQRGVQAVGVLPGQTSRDAFQHFAIALDNELVSVPYIDSDENPEGFDPRQGSQISGGFTPSSAQELANVLKTGALPLDLELISSSQVSATLGKQALNQGLAAGIAGFMIVALFLLVVYRILGVIAVVALGVYGVYFYALIELIPVVLTLPGIAGLILTLGVAADANIVIFERVKEEVRAGRSITAAITAGYKKGLTAIIDANVVTIMVAFILFVLATAGVQGFALTLGLGVIVSLFTAVVATQAIVGTMGKSRLLQRPSALGAGKPKGDRLRLDYMGYSKYFFSFSGLILVVCALALGAKGINLGIDFESGSRIDVALSKQADEGDIRNVLADAGQPSAEIQRVEEKGPGASKFQISTESLKPLETDKINSSLERKFGFARAPNSQNIGPTFGQTVASSAIIAIIASLIVISAYIALRFEAKYAVPVLIAVMHDILITAGVYALIGQEVTTATVAALLTVLGFSLYDTIIVFDRIRENVPRMPRAAFSQIVNRSMSEVIVRSLATSFCSVLPVLSLLLFGGETLRDFAFALLVGTISGTYSSVFIAGPVLTAWKEREPVYRRRHARIAAENNGLVPAFATSAAGASTDVEPEHNKRARRAERITAPDDPERGVSREEFEDMVRDLHVDPAPKPTGRAAVLDEEEEEVAPRRAKAKAAAPASSPDRPAAAPSKPDEASDASPEDVIMPDRAEPGGGARRKPKASGASASKRKGKHGRKR
ncbi:MAG: protein translocase subunit SecD [Actinomycetota bacterium]|nr:protein translocase subunit SecD [Actinomycetota bacterium]